MHIVCTQTLLHQVDSTFLHTINKDRIDGPRITTVALLTAEGITTSLGCFSFPTGEGTSSQLGLHACCRKSQYKLPVLYMAMWQLFTKQALSSWFSYSNHQLFSTVPFCSLSPHITSSFSIQSPICTSVSWRAHIAYRGRFLALSVTRRYRLPSLQYQASINRVTQRFGPSRKFYKMIFFISVASFRKYPGEYRDLTGVNIHTHHTGLKVYWFTQPAQMDFSTAQWCQ